MVDGVGLPPNASELLPKLVFSFSFFGVMHLLVMFYFSFFDKIYIKSVFILLTWEVLFNLISFVFLLVNR